MNFKLPIIFYINTLWKNIIKISRPSQPAHHTISNTLAYLDTLQTHSLFIVFTGVSIYLKSYLFHVFSKQKPFKRCPNRISLKDFEILKDKIMLILGSELNFNYVSAI